MKREGTLETEPKKAQPSVTNTTDVAQTHIRVPGDGELDPRSGLSGPKIRELTDKKLWELKAFKSAAARALEGDKPVVSLFGRFGITVAELARTKSKDRRKERDRARQLIDRIKSQVRGGATITPAERIQLFGAGPPVKSIVLPNAGDSKKGVRLVRWLGPGGLQEYLEWLEREQNPEAA